LSEPFFRFKRFVVYQSDKVFKVCTESVLLGAWCELVRHDARCLDIGTGTGILSLILVQKGAVKITALDVDAHAVAQAKENFYIHNTFFTSPASIEVIRDDMFRFASAEKNQHAFDFIISNPPYFTTSLPSPHNSKNLQKHARGFSWDRFAGSAGKLLKEGGKLVFVFPEQEKKKVFESLHIHGFRVIRIAGIHYGPGRKKPSRIMLECVKASRFVQNRTEEEIFVYDENGEYTEAYKNYVKEFYLKF
jgi:tRNA1Val (adenine37-N6)-methyltransferase